MIKAALCAIVLFSTPAMSEESNPLIGTWVLAAGAPRGCRDKDGGSGSIEFTQHTMIVSEPHEPPLAKAVTYDRSREGIVIIVDGNPTIIHLKGEELSLGDGEDSRCALVKER